MRRAAVISSQADDRVGTFQEMTPDREYSHPLHSLNMMHFHCFLLRLRRGV